MDYRVEWSPRAVEDLEAIAAYIAADSAAYAAAVVKNNSQYRKQFLTISIFRSCCPRVRR